MIRKLETPIFKYMEKLNSKTKSNSNYTDNKRLNRINRSMKKIKRVRMSFLRSKRKRIVQGKTKHIYVQEH